MNAYFSSLKKKIKIPKRLTRHFRIYFVTGLIVLAPVALTGYILINLFATIDGWLAGIFSKIDFFVIGGSVLPGLGFLTIIAIVITTGMIARNVVGRATLSFIEGQLNRVPLVRRVYGAIKQISDTFIKNDRTAFKHAALVEFPRKDCWVIAFVTSDASGEIESKLGQQMCTVFLPTTPNPTSGYMLIVKKDDIKPLDMSVEEAVKLVISGGAVLPEQLAQVEAETKQAEG